MKIALLIIIYLIFISLGLPDSFIGSCWPTISEYFAISRDFQGIFSLIVSFFTIASSFLTIKLTKYLKNYGVIAISIGLTISGLIIIGFSDNYYLLLLAAIPLGFGGGAIDSIKENITGLFFEEQTVQSIIDCINMFESMESQFTNREAYTAHVQQFSKNQFIQKMSHLIEEKRHL